MADWADRNRAGHRRLAGERAKEHDPDCEPHDVLLPQASSTSTNLDDVSGLLLRTAVDDGAVVWLNGHEVLRHQMPAAPAVITYATRSTRTPTSWDTQIEGPFPLDTQWLVEGENVLAIEVHQATNSNDMGFAAILDLQRTIQPVEPPPLVLSELNYHPHEPTPEELAINPAWTSEDFEFAEVLNTGVTSVALNGVKLAQAVDVYIPGDLTAGGSADRRGPKSRCVRGALWRRHQHRRHLQRHAERLQRTDLACGQREPVDPAVRVQRQRRLAGPARWLGKHAGDRQSAGKRRDGGQLASEY